MKKIKSKTCLNCLHCKVSAKSTANNRLCYCGIADKVKKHKEFYWLTKKVCNAFNSMD
jgi:hypothetical protein